MNKLKLKKVKISQLKPNPNNPRIKLNKNDFMYQELAESIKKFGYVNPIVINKRTKQILNGHLRLEVLKELKVDEIEIIEVDIPKSKENGLVIGLNSIKGDWDVTKLQNLVHFLANSKVDFRGSGLTDGEVKVLLSQVGEEQKIKRILQQNNDNVKIKWSCNIGACSFKISDELFKRCMDLIEKGVSIETILEEGCK